MKDDNGGSAISAFLLGGVIGLAAGVLLAPRSGRDTRRKLQRFIDELEDRGGDLLEEGREMIEEGKDMVNDQSRRMKRVIDNGRKLWDNVTDRD
jgi:gas vesicle protein